MALVKTSKIMIIALVIAAVALAGSTLAAVTVNTNLSSSGTITTSPNIGAYSDSGCTNALTTINWGSIAAGAASTHTVYVKNTGTGTMTLNMTVSGWSPAGASTYIAVTWNKEATNLSAGSSTAAILTLTVSSSITGITTFSNTITISGTG
jgi:hypothetical protein